MPYRFATALLLVLLTAPAWVFAQNGPDWAQVGAEARERKLMVALLVTGPDCGHCVRMHQEFLEPASTRDSLEREAVIREISREQGGKVTDFDGERIRARHFLARYGVYATPTLLFLSPEGEPLAPPIVGFNDPLNYGDMLTKRLERARLSLASGERATPSMLAGGD